jgi:hypothetical protein
MQTRRKGDKDTHVEDDGGAGDTDCIECTKVTMSAEGIRDTGRKGGPEGTRDAEGTTGTKEGTSRDDKMNNDENDSGYGSER